MVFRTPKEKLAIVRQYKKAKSKKQFFKEIGISGVQVRRWAQGLALKSRPGKAKREFADSYVQPVSIPSIPVARDACKSLRKENERLKLENTVLRANLTMAMQLGYLDFLSLESQHVKC